MEQLLCLQADLREMPLPNTELIQLTDGLYLRNSEGIFQARYTYASLTEIIESGLLPSTRG